MNTSTTRNGLSHSECGKLGYLASIEKLAAINKKRIDAYNINPKRCHGCKNSLEYEKRFNKFCSSSCCASYSNQRRIRIRKCLDNDPTIKVVRIVSETRKIKTILTKECKFCHKIFELKNGTKQKYCDSNCQAQETRTDIYHRIETSGTGKGSASKTIRAYLIQKRGCKCEMCGITEWLGKPLIVVMDHINGNSDDWSLTNLRLICSNCDTTTPFYKNKNKGNGRYSRRERYKNGQSY